jgi:Transposase DDE domain
MYYRNYIQWMTEHIVVKNRLKNVCIAYLLFLMVEVRKHSFKEAAQFSGLHKSQFSRFLENHSDLAVYNLDRLSKKEAKRLRKLLKGLEKDTLLWKIAIIIDSTLQKRTTRHTDNAQRFNHGKGFVIGHQWTNILLIINDRIIPLPPIPYYTKNYCRKNGIPYKTEHELVIEYLNALTLDEYIGHHTPEQVVVIADSGYDDHEIENTIAKKKWKFIIALGKTRSVKSKIKFSTTPQSRGWYQVEALFKRHRRPKWQTIRIGTNGTKRRRTEFRIRQINGYLRSVGYVQLICSEYKKRPDGRRKYLACNDMKATARQIVIGYRIRWRIEIFHKEVKSYLGFEDVSARCFASVKAHVHWVYCAYILLHYQHDEEDPLHSPPLSEKQNKIKHILNSKEISRIRSLLSQFGGVDKYKRELLTALDVT